MVGKKADFYSVHSLRGVFIASKLHSGSLADYANARYKTMITYNKGAIWEELTIPSAFYDKKLKTKSAAAQACGVDNKVDVCCSLV